MIGGKLVWLQEEVRKEDISIALMIREEFSTSVLFKDTLEAISLILRLQDNVVIGNGIFHYIYHKGCAFNLHSKINNGLIPGGQDVSRRQIVFFLPIDLRDKGHQDPEKIDLNVPRRAQYLHNAWKKHQDAAHWVDISLAIRKGLTFFQTRTNAIILEGTLPAYCIPKVERLKLEKSCTKDHTCLLDHHQRSHCDTITIGPEGIKEKDQGSTVEQQPVGKLVQQSFGEAPRVLLQTNPIQTQSNQ